MLPAGNRTPSLGAQIEKAAEGAAFTLDGHGRLAVQPPSTPNALSKLPKFVGALIPGHRRDATSDAPGAPVASKNTDGAAASSNDDLRREILNAAWMRSPAFRDRLERELQEAAVPDFGKRALQAWTVVAGQQADAMMKARGELEQRFGAIWAPASGALAKAQALQAAHVTHLGDVLQDEALRSRALDKAAAWLAERDLAAPGSGAARDPLLDRALREGADPLAQEVKNARQQEIDKKELTIRPFKQAMDYEAVIQSPGCQLRVVDGRIQVVKPRNAEAGLQKMNDRFVKDKHLGYILQEQADRRTDAKSRKADAPKAEAASKVRLTPDQRRANRAANQRVLDAALRMTAGAPKGLRDKVIESATQGVNAYIEQPPKLFAQRLARTLNGLDTIHSKLNDAAREIWTQLEQDLEKLKKPPAGSANRHPAPENGLQPEEAAYHGRYLELALRKCMDHEAALQADPSSIAERAANTHHLTRKSLLPDADRLRFLHEAINTSRGVLPALRELPKLEADPGSRVG